MSAGGPRAEMSVQVTVVPSIVGPSKRLLFKVQLRRLWVTFRLWPPAWRRFYKQLREMESRIDAEVERVCLFGGEDGRPLGTVRATVTSDL